MHPALGRTCRVHILIQGLCCICRLCAYADFVSDSAFALCAKTVLIKIDTDPGRIFADDLQGIPGV